MKLVLFYLFILVGVFAQSIYITSEVDTSKASIGDIIIWQIKSDNPSQDNKLEFPEIKIKSDSISIFSQKSIFENNEIIGRTIEIAFWDTGSFYIPSYIVNVLDEKGKFRYNLETEKIPIKVISILESLDDASVRPVKGPVAVKGIIHYRQIFLIILSLLIIFLIFWVWKKRIKNIYEKSKQSIKKTAIEIAMERLSCLDSKGFSKDFYTELSHITREYIEYSSYIRTLEMTTEEIITNRNLFSVDENLFFDWITLLKKADLIKYAKESSNHSEMENDKDTAINIINNFFT
ncbi:MAG: hypothetical protein CBD77_01315 [bacterium TMED217]|nr:MAG: hypothetical protein CBD77_01315 [bacterium TMED217]